MKLSPLQLNRYVITDVGCTADPAYDPAKEIGAALEHLSINVKANQLASEKNTPGHSWSVELEIAQKKAEGQNLPYAFHISIFGIFDFLDRAAESEKEKRFVQVNGSSILFAMAREQIRALTAAGPWGVVILPTMSFYDKKEESPKKLTEEPKNPS